MSIDDMFASMGISPEEVVDDRKDQYLVDKRICLCGHSITKHKDVNDNKYKNDFGSLLSTSCFSMSFRFSYSAYKPSAA